MQDLIIEATQYTPKIDFMPKEGMLNINGHSYPENTYDFYFPILKWLENFFLSKPKNQITLNLEMVYINSSTSRILFDILDLITEAKDTGCLVCINWIYDSENDMAEEMGLDYQQDFETLNFNLLKK